MTIDQMLATYNVKCPKCTETFNSMGSAGLHFNATHVNWR